MSEHEESAAELAPPPSGLARFTRPAEAFLKRFYTWVGYLGAAVLGAVILGVLYSIIARKFGSSLRGSQELIEQALVLIVFLTLGIEHMGQEKMIVDVLTTHLPQKLRRIIAPVIHAIAVAILVIAAWQLVVWSMSLQDRGQTTMGVLGLPLYPFAYVSAFGIATLVPIWLIRFLNSIDEAVRR
jgi:TRAP-type C4-dicarboxylate transport system permease small subunit